MAATDARWIQWWCAPWQWAHPGWVERFVEGGGWPLEDVESLLRGRHSAFLASVGIAPSQPPMPVDGVLQWVLLSAEQQDLALRLAASIGFGRVVDASEDAAYEPWCRGVAKALRPGAWLEPELCDARVLLAAWAGEACWARLRLRWAPQAVPLSVSDLPGHKLQTLWQAVLWRVTRV